MVPVFLVLIIFFPSVFLLKTHKKNIFFEKILNVIGHQWNWEYEYAGYRFVSSPEESSNFRLLSCRSFALIDSNVKTLIKVASDDVIHRFSLPSLGIKVDAVPGRVNEVVISGLSSKIGVFSGQCSEICGILHSKMPICVVALPL